jgi:hypothetical protein
MKKFLLFLTSALIIVSCSSTKKQLQRGNYDAVISKSVKKLIKDPDSSEDVKLVDRSYKLANERDLERIKYLKMENNPNNYDEIFSRYESLKARQSLVRTVLPMNLNGNSVNYEYVDYDTEIINSKRKAAEYYYANGKKLLENSDKESYRIAHEQLSRARDYSGDSFPGLNEMIIKAQNMGMSRVIVQVDNSARIMISPEFQDELLSFNAQGLNNGWVEYHFRHLNDEIDYDYVISVHIMDILVSPEETKNKDIVYKKDVEDGFSYKLDSRGNVMKDTAGNDIKIPKYKSVQCVLIETSQRKAVQIRGEVEIIELVPAKRLLVKEPIWAENVFENISARAVGDQAALDDEAKMRIKSPALPYPSDIQMIFNTAETLKPAIRNSIYNNRRYIR